MNVKINNVIVFGKCASGKTTQLIRMIRELLLNRPDLKVGVCEEYAEIKSAVPNVISVSKPSVELDLFVCTYDFYMIELANSMNIPVWCEILGDETKLYAVQENIPCTKNFKSIQMKFFEIVTKE